MDVLLHQSSVFELPSSRRVGAIVHDGATDLQLWPAPGPDRDLSDAWGPGLQEALDREGEQSGGVLPIGGLLRVHRGRLHCDFLLWAATRPPEDAGRQAPAPAIRTIEDVVRSALQFVAARNVVRLAFGPLGHGPDAADEVERLVAVAKASQSYYDDCFREGKNAVLEEVIICHRSGARVSEARRKLGRLVRALSAPPPALAAKPVRKATRKKASTGRSSTARTTRKKVSLLSDDEVASARAAAAPYDRAQTYAVGQFFVHPKFGVGRVEEVTPEGFIQVLFEGGATKRMLHARP